MVSPDGVAPIQMDSVSASVNLPLHHKVQKFSSGTGSPGWSRKKGRKTVVVAPTSSNLTSSESQHNADSVASLRSHLVDCDFSVRILHPSCRPSDASTRSLQAYVTKLSISCQLLHYSRSRLIQYMHGFRHRVL